jgi:hypothetical protein
MSKLSHIEDFSQFVQQESLIVFLQCNKINSLKLVNSSKERGNVPSEVQDWNSSICNLGRASSCTSGNSTKLSQIIIRNSLRAGNAPQHVKELGRYSKLLNTKN